MLRSTQPPPLDPPTHIASQPRLSLPSTIVSYVVRQGLPANIRAVAQRAEEVREAGGRKARVGAAGGGVQWGEREAPPARHISPPPTTTSLRAQLAARQLRASGLASWAGVEEDPPLPAITAGASTSSSSSSSDEEGALPAAAAAAASSRAVLEDGLPCKGPFWPQGSSYAAAAPLTAAQQRRRAEEDAARSLYLGVTSVPVPPAGKLGGLMGGNPGLQQELDERQRQKELLQAAYPAFGLQRAGGGGAADSSDESGGEAEPTPAPPAAAAGASTPPPDSGYVASALSAAAAAGLAQVHLRRLDGLDYLHRRAVGAITVHAPPHLVWSVLTDYNRLADFVPNLAVRWEWGVGLRGVEKRVWSCTAHLTTRPPSPPLRPPAASASRCPPAPPPPWCACGRWGTSACCTWRCTQSACWTWWSGRPGEGRGEGFGWVGGEGRLVPFGTSPPPPPLQRDPVPSGGG